MMDSNYLLFLLIITFALEKCRFFLCLSFLFLFITIKAQENFDYFSITKLTQDDGLSQGSNYFRFEDSHGFMWITGNDALNRYDGSSVKVYNLKQFFKNCPALQQGYGFAEDGKYLYVGSTRGLYRYDYQKDEFSLIEIFRNARTKTAMPAGFSNGKIWCFNEDWQLAGFDVKTGKVHVEANIPLLPIKSVHVYDNQGNIFYLRMPFIDKNQNICFTGKENVILYNIRTRKTGYPLLHFPEFKDVIFTSCDYDREKDFIYLGTEKNGIITLKNQYQQIENIFKTEKKIAGISSGKDKIIYGINQEGITILNKNFKKVKTLKKGFERAFAFGFDKIGRFWACDDGQGEIILNFNGTLLKKSSDIDNEKIKNSFVLGTNNFAELPDGTVFIHSLIFNPKNYAATYFRGGHSNFNAFSDVNKDRFWILQMPKNNSSEIILSLLDRNKKVLKEIKIPLKQIGDLKHFQTFNNNFPMISSEEGLFWLNTEKGSLEKITTIKNSSPFYINKISGNRIIITYLNSDAALAQVNPGGKIQFLKSILPEIQSFYFQEDKKSGHIWAGTNEGVFQLDRNFRILRKFDSNNGLAGTYIYGLIPDDSGKIWCSHQHGLSSIDMKNYSIINFDKEDGIQHWDFNNRGFYKTSDGTLFFGGVNGFNFFRPPLRFSASYKPEIYFDEIKINNTQFTYNKGINQITEIRLKHNENSISIKALIRDLENGNRQQLMYRFRNLDGRWKPLAHKNPLVLSSLSPGKYDLEFGIYNKFSQVTIPQKKLFIVIGKAYYQAFWFWAFLGGFIIGAIVFVFTRWKMMQQKNYYRQQLALEEQRNKITADLHDDIGSTLSSLQINSAVAALYLEKNDLPETQSILSKIQQQSQKLSENMGDIVWSLKPGHETLMTLSTRIRNFANEILGNTSIDYEITIDKETDAEITDFEIRKNIILIIKEALNNAAKYSNATKVSVLFKLTDKKYILEIKDNGNGFNPEEKTGNGLQNMKKRTEEMSGIFELLTGKGTYIIIRIPRFRE